MDSETGHDVQASLPAARAGSPQALGDMLAACRAYLLMIAQQEMDPTLQAKGGASDLVQDTLLEAHRDFADFQGDSEPELLGWLRRILLHNLANFKRAYLRTDKRRVAREVPLQSDRSSKDYRQWLAVDSISPSAQVRNDEQSRALDAAIAKLPPDYQRIIFLRHRDGLGFDCIAATMNRTNGAVRKLWARAVQRLREHLEVDDDSGRES